MGKDLIKSLIICTCTVFSTVLFSLNLYGITINNNGFKYNLCKQLFNSQKQANNIFLEPITTVFNPYSYLKQDLSESLNYAISILVYDYKKQLDEILKIKLKDVRFKNTILAMEKAKTKIYNLYQILELFDGLEVTINISAESEKLLEDLNIYEEAMFSDRVKRIYKKHVTDNSLSKQDHFLLEKYCEHLNCNSSQNNYYKREQIKQELSTTKEKLERILSASNQYDNLQHTLSLRNITDLDNIDNMYPALNLKSRIEIDSLGNISINLSSMELSYILFFSDSEYLRKKVFKIMSTSSTNDIQYNLITGKIFRLSHEYSNLNGYKNYSDFVLHSNTRFRDINEVYDMLKVSLNRINKKIRTSKNIFAKKILNTEPYNYIYTLNKIKKDINSSSQIFNYLEINSVLSGVIEVFEKIFEVKFLERNHTNSKDIKIYDIIDQRTNQIVSTIYMNLGTNYDGINSSSRHLPSFKIIRQKTEEFYPIFQLNLNLTTYKNPITQLETIVFNDIYSLFHELGHCFYFNLLEPSYFALKDNFEYIDFIEYPSIFMEQLARHKDIAKIYLKDYVTKEPMDDRLLSKVLDIKNIEYFTSRVFQLIISYVDIKSYATNFDSSKAFSLKTEEFLNGLSKQIQILDVFPNVLKNPPYLKFNTMFSEFYAAKCYIYTLAYNLTEYSMEKDIQANKIHILNFNIKEYLQNLYKGPSAFIYKVLQEY